MFSSPKHITIDNDSICYYREGSGETVLFIHGITTYSFIWRNVIPPFLNDFDVIAIDLLGSGDSDKPLNKDYSLNNQAKIIQKICSKLNINKAHMVCHDVGGGIGQIFAVKYPELLKSLVLINSVAYNFWPVQPIIAMRTPIIRQMAMAVLDAGMFQVIVKRGLYHKTHVTKELMNYFLKPMKEPLGRKGLLHFAKSLDNKNLTDIEKEIREIKIPVLIIRGDADIYLSASISNKLHSEIPNSQLEHIETGGHFIQEDEPELVAKITLNFIRK